MLSMELEIIIFYFEQSYKAITEKIPDAKIL